MYANRFTRDAIHKCGEASLGFPFEVFLTDPETTELVRLCLKSTFFSYCGEIYKQVEGVAMGSPLSPIFANLYMENFEKMCFHQLPD